MTDLMINAHAMGYRLRAMGPRSIVLACRGATVVIGLAAMGVYRLGQVDETSAIWITLALGIALLSGYPRHRLSDLMAVLALWLTAIETITGCQVGHFAWRRWLFVLATLGLILLMRWLQDFRAIARDCPERPIGQGDRRRAHRMKSHTAHSDIHDPAQTSSRELAIDGFCRTVRP